MKSDIIAIRELPADAANALAETERAAAYNHLQPQSVNTLRLLAEEAIAVTADVLKSFVGQFWLENDGPHYELHLLAAASIGLDELDTFVDLSTAKNNTYPKGLKGKLSSVIDAFLIAQGETAAMGVGISGMLGGISASPDSMVWTMSRYQQETPAEEPKDEELEGIERSIIERYADDIVVTVRSNRVELVVKKTLRE